MGDAFFGASLKWGALFNCSSIVLYGHGGDAVKKSYTEMQVLKKLDIPDFRHMTKDKVIAFASMLPNMNPEVAKKALEQFPDFASTSLGIMKEYKNIIEAAMEDDRESTQVCYDMYNRIMDSLEKMLENENLNFDEQCYILEQMKIVADEVARKDSEKANNHMKLISIVGGIGAIVIGILGSAIGVNMVSKQDDIENKDKNND